MNVTTVMFFYATRTGIKRMGLDLALWEVSMGTQGGWIDYWGKGGQNGKGNRL